jgi:hypothetical protein
VYYILPHKNVNVNELADYLNSEGSRRWLAAHCQRAANDYLRLQSAVVRRLPVPVELGIVVAHGMHQSAAELAAS